MSHARIGTMSTNLMLAFLSSQYARLNGEKKNMSAEFDVASQNKIMSSEDIVLVVSYLRTNDPSCKGQSDKYILHKMVTFLRETNKYCNCDPFQFVPEKKNTRHAERGGDDGMDDERGYQPGVEDWTNNNGRHDLRTPQVYKYFGPPSGTPVRK